VKYSLVFIAMVSFPMLVSVGCSDPPDLEATDQRYTSHETCIGAIEGKRCLGWTETEKRGWTGFCVAEVCTEYVPVHCRTATKLITGCDGSGKVTEDLSIQFEHEGRIYRCRGDEGEFGYCVAGKACSVLTSENQNPTLIEIGVCE